MRQEITRKYSEKYSLGVVDSDNSLAAYNSFYRNMGFKDSIEELVEKRLSKKVFVKVLDLGCGNAGFLSDLKKIFGETIHTIGIDLLAPPSPNTPDELIVGDALGVQFPVETDLVFSFRSLHEIGEPEKIVEKTFGCLSAGGKAFLSFRTMDLYAGGTGIGELGQKEVKALLGMVRSRRHAGFRVNGFEVALKQGGKSAVAGVNVFLEK